DRYVLSVRSVSSVLVLTRATTMDRRGFLKNVAGAVAGTAALESTAAESQSPQTPARPQGPPPMQAAAESEPPADVDVLTTDRCGADGMVDVLKALDFAYVCANPGSSFRALHESIVNYGGNRAPEFLTCCHEESAVAMAHGY